MTATWQLTHTIHKTLVPQRPRHSFGVNVVIRYMEWDCALYRAVRQQGLAEAEALQLIADINWDIFGPPTRLMFPLSRLRSAQRLRRVRWVVDWMFRLLFASPFQRKIHPGTREVAFDVVACPLAQYFRTQGVPELTAFAACRLDHRMAEVWGVTLHRQQTIADGYPLCDFRFRLPEKGRKLL